MHIGILSAIRVEGLPISGELLRGDPKLLLPKTVLKDRRHIRKQTAGIGMAGDFSAGCGEQNEGVPVGLLRAVSGPPVTDAPKISAVLGVPMAVPEEIHAVVDNYVRARAPH